MIKTILLLIGQIIGVIAANLTFLWIIIEFILYLAKDKIFNWWSVWLFIISCAVAIGLFITNAIYKRKLDKKIEEIKKDRYKYIKRKFLLIKEELNNIKL